MKVTIETITPAIAKKWLGANTCNRNLREVKIHEYANEMAAGRWHETGDPIRFFDDGSIADGQHRLLGIVESGVTIRNVVIRGLAVSAMAGIDVGAKRSTADYMHLHHGTKNANAQCAAVRGIYSLCFNYQNYVLGAGLVKIGLDIYGAEILKTWNSFQHLVPLRKGWIVGSVAFAAKSHPQLDEFIHILSTGENAKRGNPALTARNWLISGTSVHLGKSYKAGAYECLFNAMNAYVKGESITSLKSGQGGINVFRAKQRKFIESVREEIKRLRPAKA